MMQRVPRRGSNGSGRKRTAAHTSKNTDAVERIVLSQEEAHASAPETHRTVRHFEHKNGTTKFTQDRLPVQSDTVPSCSMAFLTTRTGLPTVNVHPSHFTHAGDFNY